jgi:Flp pilus assembly pilin Flp
MIEYALIAALVALVLVGVLAALGTSLQSPFQDATAGLNQGV